MTCVVGRPGTLVADSRITGNTKTSGPKVFRPRPSYLVGFAGDLATAQWLQYVVRWPDKPPTLAAMVRLLTKVHDGNTKDLDQVSLLVATRVRLLVVEGRSVAVQSTGAIGSGAEYALGYLVARPTDLQGAVAAACRHCPYTAGPVVTWNVP